jgi:hypothetical protein
LLSFFVAAKNRVSSVVNFSSVTDCPTTFSTKKPFFSSSAARSRASSSA